MLWGASGEGAHNHPLPTPHEDVPHRVGGGLCPKNNFLAPGVLHVGAFAPPPPPKSVQGDTFLASQWLAQAACPPPH